MAARLLTLIARRLRHRRRAGGATEFAEVDHVVRSFTSLTIVGQIPGRWTADSLELCLDDGHVIGTAPVEATPGRFDIAVPLASLARLNQDHSIALWLVQGRRRLPVGRRPGQVRGTVTMPTSVIDAGEGEHLRIRVTTGKRGHLRLHCRSLGAPS